MNEIAYIANATMTIHATTVRAMISLFMWP